jgi:hypothetical protein
MPMCRAALVNRDRKAAGNHGDVRAPSAYRVELCFLVCREAMKSSRVALRESALATADSRAVSVPDSHGYTEKGSWRVVWCLIDPGKDC